MLADHSVCVGRVTDDDGSNVTFAVVVDGLSGFNEDLSVVFKEVGAFHSRATGFGTNQEVIVDFLEGSGEVAGDDDFVEEGESAVVEFSLDTLEDLFLEREIEQVEDDALILTEELATKDIFSCSFFYLAILKTME